MKREERDLSAAEYVLGTLDAPARKHVRGKLGKDPALQQVVEAWEGWLSPLSAGERPIDPPAGLWDKIEAKLDRAEPETFAMTVRAEEGHWQVLVEGVEKKVLFIDRLGGYESFLLRLAPGASLSSHPHGMTEECLMLAGEVSIGDLHLGAGDYHVISAGTSHPALSTRKGGLLYVRGELREATG